MSSRRGLAGSSALMFSGTLVSRLLGMVREPLLLGAAIGINYGAANAFAVANRLPNLIHLLIAGGVLNAVLVPQIVRAMKGQADGGERYVNRLLTMSAVALAAITLVLTAAATVLVSIYASDLPPQWYDLAVVFAVWTIPQLFFYGMYTVLGQVLNARGNFGPYMWAPAINNVVAIAGLGVYLAVFGGVGESPTGDASIWTVQRVALLAGTATLGVAVQAVILLWPLRRSGFRYRPEWGLRGSGLGRASRVATWVFGSVVVGQLANVLVVRAAVNAAERGAGALDVPGPAAYNPAYTLFILPNSLVVVSLVTALFTRMSANAATGQLGKVRADLSLGLRTVGLFTVFGTGALMVLALPIMRVLTGTVSYAESQSIARVAVAMLAGLVGMGALTVVQRVYYAFEDTRRLFWIQLPAAGIVAAGALLAMLLPPEWTLVGVGVAMTVSNTVAAAVCFVALRRHLPSIDGGRVLRAHVRLTAAAAPAVLAGWGLLHLLGVGEDELDVFGAAWRAVLVGTVMALLYFVLLRLLHVEELASLLRSGAPLLAPVARRMPPVVGRVLERAGLPLSPAGQRPDAETPDPGTPDGRDLAMPAGPGTTPGTTTPGAGAVPVRTLGNDGPPSGAGGASTGGGTLNVQDEEHAVTAGTTLLGDRYQLVEPLPALLSRTTRWRARDLVLNREVEAVLLRPDDPRTPEVIDAARRAAVVEDPRLLGVLDVGGDASVAYLVTDLLPGVSLADVVAGGPVPADQARALIGEATSALETARRRGVRHQALRPQSVRVTADGRVVVTGLAVDSALLGTRDDEPVQAARQDAVDLARLLYLALTGLWPSAAPADDAEEEDLTRYASGGLPAAPWGESAPVAPSALRGDVPEDLDRICVDVLAGRTHAPHNPTQLIRKLAPWGEVDYDALPVPPAREPGHLEWRSLAEDGTEAGEAPLERPTPPDDAPPSPPEAPAGDAAHRQDAAAQEARLHAAQAAAGPAAGAAVTPPPPPPESGAVHAGLDDTPALDPSAWVPHHFDDPEPSTPPFGEVLHAEEVEDQPPGAEARARHTTATGAAAALAGLRAVGEALAESARAATTSTGAALSRATTTGRERYTAYAQQRRERAEARAAEDARIEREHDARLADRDTVPVQPADGYVPPQERRIDPTPIALGLGLVALLVIGGLAVRGLTAPVDERPVPADPAPQTAEPAPEEEAGDQPPEDTAEPDAPPPAIASLAPLDPQGDGAENPELTPMALDGDPSTYWRSRRYDNPEYGMKEGIGLAVTLEQATEVTEVELSVLGQGGLVQVRDATPEDPLGGAVLAESEMGPDTVLTFDPVSTDVVVLWFPRLPVADSDGLNRVELAEIAVR